MPQGLNVNDIVSVSLSLNRIAAGFQNFGATVLIGSESFIDTNERIRQYADVSGVLSDAGSTSPLSLAAQLFFSQSPQPQLLYLARWAQFDTAGLLHGAILTPSQRLISNFTSITSGGLKITVDGQLRTLTGLNFSGALNLNGVAAILQAALAAVSPGATVLWDATISRFTVTSGTTGATSTVGYATAPGTGIDISGTFGLVTGRASAPVTGMVAESLVQAIAKIADVSSDWYAAVVATATAPVLSDHLAAASLIESLPRRRVYGITTQDTACLDPTRSDDIASQMMALGLQRTFVQYSSWSSYAVASFIARAATVDFSASNTAITLKFKGEPGIIAERLTESQAAALKAKNCNAYVAYANGTAIIQEGIMAGGFYFDEIQGTDWYVDYVQTNVYNALQQAPTKVPQTDAGMNLLKTIMDQSAEQAVRNGLAAPGRWNLPGFGQLAQGDILDLGYYTYAPPIDDQAQATREKRISVPFQQALKLAGAVHFAGLAITVNR